LREQQAGQFQVMTSILEKRFGPGDSFLLRQAGLVLRSGLGQ
jgi:hypothetical protein